MARLAVSGHRGLPPATERLVADCLRAEISRRADDGLVGLTCLADGADCLFARAVTVTRLDHVEPDAESYMAASLRMLADADELLAVWDGEPARGYGGTADVVDAARASGLAVTVIWPTGAVRD